MEKITYTYAQCIGNWDLEVPNKKIEAMRNEIFLRLSQQEDKFNYAAAIGKWED
jgi:hypothetical protein